MSATGFAALPGEAQVAHLEALARQALGAWSLADAGLALVKYRENAVFAVGPPGQPRFALRVHRPGYRSDAEIRSELAWMRALDAAGIRTPEAVPAASGELLAHACAPGDTEARQCDLLRWVPGARLGSIEGGVEGGDDAVARSYRLVGELAARVHEQAVRWPRPAGFVRPVWGTASLVGESPAWGRFWELEDLPPAARRVLLRARDRCRQELDALGRAPDRWGLLHGDLLPENILVAEDGPRLIDFDDCGEGWFGFELATGLFPLLVAGSAGPACEAYLAGYRGLRPFPDEQVGWLPTFLAARALSYLGWPAGRPEMEEMRKVVPFLTEVVTGMAERYLAGALQVA